MIGLEGGSAGGMNDDEWMIQPAKLAEP